MSEEHDFYEQMLADLKADQEIERRRLEYSEYGGEPIDPMSQRQDADQRALASKDRSMEP